MRITVEIDESTIQSIQHLTGLKKKSPAISKALHDYLRDARKRRLIQGVMEGKSDYSTTNEELEASAAYDPH
jgi:Arc/MetJ family transcription regulator